MTYWLERERPGLLSVLQCTRPPHSEECGSQCHGLPDSLQPRGSAHYFLVHGISPEESRSGRPFPFHGIFLDPGMETGPGIEPHSGIRHKCHGAQVEKLL